MRNMATSADSMVNALSPDTDVADGRTTNRLEEKRPIYHSDQSVLDLTAFRLGTHTETKTK